MTFTEEDVKKMREFGFFLNEKARFKELSIAEAAKLITYLQFYNQLAQKVEDHIMEVVQVHKPSASEAKTPAKKADRDKKS